MRGQTTGVLLGANGTEAHWIYKICGGTETLVATLGSESAEYTFGISFNEPSATIYYFSGGIRRKLLGCRGNLSVVAGAGRPARGIAVVRGLLGNEEDIPFPDLSTAPGVDPRPPIVKSANFMLGGWAAIWEELRIDTNAELSVRPGPNTPQSITPYVIGDYNPTGGLNPEVVALSTFDVRQNWLDKNGLPLSMGPIGADAGNRLQITAPRTQLRAPGLGVRNLYRIYDLTIGLKVTPALDDFLTLDFT